MRIKELIRANHQAFTEKYANRLLPSHRKALDAILACRSQCGEFYTQCDHCHKHTSIPLSCGHRSCPQCQNHLSRIWLERQKQKLLPVNYFLVTFTIPEQLRSLVWEHQTIMYDLLFKASIEAIQTIGRNNHQVELGATGVLHTHKRDKGYHPHVHFIVPGGGVIIDGNRRSWKTLGQKFLVNEQALACVFRGILLRRIFEAQDDLDSGHGFKLPAGLPRKWVTNISSVGRGEKALEYLARYLYRGVISENDVFTDGHGQVVYRYRESKTNTMITTKAYPEDFLWRIIQHVLPRGFRRVRDYGFLHANSKRLLMQVQLLLKVKLPEKASIKSSMICRVCTHTTKVIMVLARRIPMVFRFYKYTGIIDTTKQGPLLS